MSFGFGVGDFITVIQLANQVRQDFAGAPDQFQQINAEVRNLAIVLQDVDVSFIEHDVTEAQRHNLREIRESCRCVLEDTQSELSKYSSLDLRNGSLGERAKRCWKRVKWEPDEVRDLRSRIISNITVLNSFTVNYTRDNVIKLVERQDQQQHREILDWLTPVEIETQQSDFVSRRQAGTGQWLIDSPEYAKWKALKGDVLFCHGIPGVGKTILSSIVVDDLQETFYTVKDVAICYHYCNFKRRDEQQLKNIISSFVKQLTQASAAVPESVTELYDQCQGKGRQPSLEETTKTLRSVARLFSRIFVVVDALDECQASDGSQSRLITELIELQRCTGANILATSRPLPHIMEKFQDFGSLDICASRDDIMKYVNGNLFRLPGFVSRNPQLLGEIVDVIVEAVDGMFLLATLHVNSLEKKKSIRALRMTLTTLKKGNDALIEAYQSTMERIWDQPKDQKEIAIQTLIWIVHAKRPLTTIELQHALSVEVGELEFLEDNIPDLEDVVSACCGLVTVDEESKIIRLVHYTMQEFFERQGASHLPNAQAEITNRCVTYISFNEFDTGPSQDEKDFEHRLARFPLYKYSSWYWGLHANGQEDLELTLGFLGRLNKVQASSQTLMRKRRRSSFLESIPSQITGLHLAAFLGLSVAIIRSLLDSFDIDILDSYCRTPLSYAAENGHEAVVRFLFDNNAQADPRDEDGQTPLWLAASGGHEAIVRILLDNNAQTDTPDDRGITPMWLAVDRGREDIVRMLLDSNAQTNTQGKKRSNPLWWAVRRGHEAIASLLLEKNAQVGTSDNFGRTMLWSATRDGLEIIVRQLLDKNAQADTPDEENGQTPLSLAAENGHDAIVRILLDKNAQVDTPDTKYGQTPLSLAARNGHEAVVRLLLDNNAQVDTPDTKYGQTPLSLAAEKGHEAVVRLLLDKNAQVDAQDTKYGQTPLSLAARNGHEAIS